ncbi:MAG: DNA mismatch repair endonuclease MutL [Clostridiales bacterium]|nr:DNA mismatch repair endonuclease MutL [Clostridiales bacterium]
MAINVLSPRIYNRISAGEVVERPASVVKELVENSLDAGATKIRVEVEEGGIKKMAVYDNGCGIAKEDIPLAFLPHATSKIADIDDLDAISTLGFRGEALASICSVSMVELSTKTKDSEMGYKIDASGGDISKISEVARLDGTTLLVQNLFYNTPARAKFLKRPKQEEGEITHLVEKFMLANPQVDFEYIVDGKTVYNHTSGQLDEVIYLIYGKDIYEKLLKLDYTEDDIKVHGYIVSPKLSRPNRTYQSLFVNGRYVENYMVSACVQGAYEPLLMKGRFPIYVIKLELPFDRVDVNVHPNKKEVKFDNSSKIFGIIRRAVEKALVGTNLIADFEFTSKEEREWEKFDIKNELHPQQTTFDSYQKSTLDKLSPDEGASFVSVDRKDLSEKLQSPKEKKNEVEIVTMPQFSIITTDKQNKNRHGGRIFFDQSGDSLYNEIKLEVEKEQKEAFLLTQAQEIKIVGVVFKTYIITEFQDSLYVIDQHAMHERQLYDKLKKQVDQNNIAKQDMLLPYVFELKAKDKMLFESKLQNLKKIGFEIEAQGDKFNICAIPFVLSGINLENFIADILADDSTNEKTASQFINEKLCQTACKHAIRAGDDVTKEEIFYLIDEMKNGVALCPHGRPIITKITKKELEKMFKRVL